MRMTALVAAGFFAMAGAATAAEPTDAKEGPVVLDEAQMDQVTAGFFSGSPVLVIEDSVFGPTINIVVIGFNSGNINADDNAFGIEIDN